MEESGLLDWDRIWIRSVAIDSPVSEDGRPWPCPLCCRFQLLEWMRLVEAEHLQGSEMVQWLLVCLDCIRDYNPHPAGA